MTLLHIKKYIYLGILLAVCLILGYIEMLIPMSIAIPGIKLGLSNLGVLMALYLFGDKEAFVLSVSKALISGLLFGNMSMILYSLSGAVLSCIMMIFLKRLKLFHIPVISALGGIVHNLGQLLVAFAYIQSKALFFYLPYLIIAGFLTGGLIGIIAGICLLRVGNFLKSEIGKHY